MTVRFGVRPRSPGAVPRATAGADGAPLATSGRAVEGLASEETVRWEQLSAALPGMSLQRALPAEAWGKHAPRPDIDRVGRYTVLTQIAGGGMSSVYVGLLRGPAGFSRLVALKCLNTRWLDDADYIARFKTEVHLSARVTHPNVVQTLDVVEVDGELFLVMEYVDGVTLAALMTDLIRQRRPLAVGIAASVAAAALRGLQAAHEAVDEAGRPLEIVHRDVSPQNIMIGRSGHVQLLDFGVAKAGRRAQQTLAGAVLGRLAYMAPERVGAGGSSPRADVFAAGVVLWEMLAGKRLFQRPGATEGDILRSVLLDTPPPLRELRADISAELEAAVSRALEREPERRFQSAREFAQALEAAGPWAPPAALGALVGDVCAERLAEKASLVQRARDMAEVEPAIERATEPAYDAALPLAPRGVALRRRRRTWLRALAGVAFVSAASAAWTAAWIYDRDTAGSDHAEGVTGAATPSDAPLTVREMQLRPLPPSAALTLASPAIASPAPAARPVVPASSPAPARAPADPEPVSSASSSRRAAGESRASGARRARSARASSGRARALSSACDPPTYVGEDGIRRFKKSCL